MVERYRVDRIEEEHLRVEAYALRDTRTGAVARVAPASGANLYSFEAPVRGAPLEVLVGPDVGSRPGFMFGTPILFPFPGLLSGGRFDFRGRTYQLDVGRRGNASHGLVHALPWKVEEAGADARGAWLRSSLTATDHPDVVRQYPFPFYVAVTHTLAEDGVRLAIEVRNAGEVALPFGFGAHPWFRLPLTSAGRRQECLVTVPASSQWEVGSDLAPTGRIVPVPADRDFRQARPLGDLVLDDFYTDVALTGGASECALLDPAAGVRVVVRADRGFREWVIYAPRGKPTICLEPYTCPDNALNLQNRGLDAGLLVLEPGQVWRGTIWITASAVALPA